MLDTALTAANRAATLIRRLLAFARHQRLDPKVVSVNAVVADLEDLLRRTLGEGISIETSLSPDLWLTEIDTDELENAILNLAINARDAMPSGGRLTLTTANTRLEPGIPAPIPTPRSCPAITSCSPSATPAPECPRKSPRASSSLSSRPRSRAGAPASASVRSMASSGSQAAM